MFRFRMEIAGQAQLDRGIARFADGVADYRPIWPVIADDFYASVAEQFKTVGEAGGDRWKELTPAYAKYKEAAFPGQPILQRTGSLASSLTNPKDSNAVYIEARKTLTLGIVVTILAGVSVMWSGDTQAKIMVSLQSATNIRDVSPQSPQCWSRWAWPR